MEYSRLEGLKRQAARDGWSKFIRTPVDEKALLKNHTFSFPAFDTFRYFAENFIKLSKGEWNGKPYVMLPFHEEICGSLFGWVKPDGLRRFRKGYIEFAKKNTKTTLFSIIGLYMLAGDGEGAPEVYNAANDASQAALLWSLAADAVESSVELSSFVKVLRATRTLAIGNSSWFKSWSSDATRDGPNAHCLLIDELHEWKGKSAREFWAKIRYAHIARLQPLCPLIITTAGDDQFSLCWEQRCVAQRVLDGVSEDLSYFASIWAADPVRIKNDPDFWKTEECWKQANPAYGYVLKKEDFEADVIAVENDPTEKATFLRYRLGVWIAANNPWLAAGVWDKNKGDPFTELDLKGQLCFLGLDMSSVSDFTAYTLVFPYMVNGVKKFRTIFRIFCPEDTLEERLRKSDVSMRVWYEQKYITTTPGDSIDHEFIFNAILADSKKFQIKQAAYDRNSAAWIVQQCQKVLPNMELFPFSQSGWSMSPPTKSLTAMLLKGRIEHNGNPVAAWMAANAVPETDGKDNMSLHKGKSKDKIDGIIALIMAYNQAELGELAYKPKFSPYSNEGHKAILELNNKAAGIKKEITNDV